MKTEKEILDMMKVLKTRQKFFEHQELQEGKSEHIYPDPNWILSPFLRVFDELNKIKKSVFATLLAILNKIPTI